jgi:hypothetical protein
MEIPSKFQLECSVYVPTVLFRSNSVFSLFFLYKNIIQFYNINHISQADCWIKLKFYKEFLDILLYLS